MSCFLNNGCATKHFNLNRGVIQVCTLSSMLFTISVEIFTLAINNSDRIKGVQSDPNHKIESTRSMLMTQLFFVKDVNSLNELFGIL